MSFLKNIMGKEMSQFKWGEIFPYHSEYFPFAENLKLLFTK